MQTGWEYYHRRHHRLRNRIQHTDDDEVRACTVVRRPRLLANGTLLANALGSELLLQGLAVESQSASDVGYNDDTTCVLLLTKNTKTKLCTFLATSARTKRRAQQIVKFILKTPISLSNDVFHVFHKQTVVIGDDVLKCR